MLKLKQVNHLMGKYYPKTFNILEQIKEVNTYFSQEYEDSLNIYKCFKSLGKTNEEIYNIWWKKYLEHKKRRSLYEKKPIRERRDNQNPETYGRNWGSGPNSNGNTIRIPSKKHKNRYKNFLKLFPKYKEK